MAEAKNENILIIEDEEDDEDEEFEAISKRKYFASAFSEIGLNYHLKAHWQLRASFAYQINFTSKKTKDFTSSQLGGSRLNLGIYYRF